MPIQGPPPLLREELVRLMVRHHAWGAVIPAGEPGTCGNGTLCELALISDGQYVGIEWSRPVGGGALCIACVIAATLRAVAAGTVVRAPFSVHVGPGEFGPEELLPLASDERPVIDANFPLAGVLRLAFSRGEFSVRSTPPGPTGNEALDLGVYSPPTLPSYMHFLHRARAGCGRLAIAPLVVRCETTRAWMRILPSAEAGVPHLAGDPGAWEQRVRAQWDAAPAVRPWLGAMLDAAACATVLGGAARDEFGPWAGDLPDVLRQAPQISPRTTYNIDGFSAPYGHDMAFLFFKTGNGAAQRRQLAKMLARRILLRDGDLLWATVREAILHVLLCTLPVPADYVPLATRVAAIRWWSTVPTSATAAVPWVDDHADLATVAAFYLRYVNMFFHPHAVPEGEMQKKFWSAFTALLPNVRDAVLARQTEQVSLITRAWINTSRIPTRPRQEGAASPSIFPIWIGGQTNSVTFFCKGRLLIRLRGIRIGCRRVRPGISSGTEDVRCCCGRVCVQRRKNGCCCVTRAEVADDLDRRIYICMRADCNAPVEPITTRGRLFVLPGSRPMLMIMCEDCGMLCFYRRVNHGDAYHCGCVPDAAEYQCAVCGLTSGPESALSHVVGNDMRRMVVCRTCVARSEHVLLRQDIASEHVVRIAREPRISTNRATRARNNATLHKSLVQGSTSRRAGRRSSRSSAARSPRAGSTR